MGIGFIQTIGEYNIDGWHLDNIYVSEKKKFGGSLAKRQMRQYFPRQ